MKVTLTLPKSDAEWCSYYKQLDRAFGTDKRSPLHHDNRCTNHKKKV